MFSTTITNTVTTEVEYRFAIGDIICWDYKMDEPVDDSSYEVVGRRMIGDEQRFDLRFLRSNHVYRNEHAPAGKALVRYVQPERGPLTETVEKQVDRVVEHEWQVGDVIKARHYPWRIDGIEFNDAGTPCYRLWDLSGDRDYGLWAISGQGSDRGYKLIGGPRFEEQQRAEEARKLTALKALQQARDLISVPEKWVQGTYQSDYGHFCAVGAIQAATPGAYAWGTEAEKALAQTRREAIDALAAIISPDADCGGEGLVTGWNDDSHRTHEQVLALFDKAIGDLEWAAVSA